MWKAILYGGLLAGVLDLTAAWIQYAAKGATPFRICQSVATGLLGRASYERGLASAALGLLCLFVIATGAAAVYVLLSQWLKVLTTHAALCGLAYGVLVYCFMNYVVLPLSAFPGKPSLAMPGLAIGLAIHMACIGLPIALVARRVLSASPARRSH